MIEQPGQIRPASQTMRLIVIGGGYTGATVVIHAIRTTSTPLHIDLVEPQADLGFGTAYGTLDPVHRINVPTNKMSVLPDDVDHLTRWLFDHQALPDAASTDLQGHHYVPRHAYGRYIEATLREAIVSARDRVSFRHHVATASAVDPSDELGAAWTVTLTGKAEPLRGDVVVLCTGHSPPLLPCPVSAAALADPRFIRNPWRRDAFAPIGRLDDVLIVGTGLSMADVIASLDRAGHSGAVTAVSRRGLLALPHGTFVDGIDFLDGYDLPRTALDLLRLVRRRMRDAAPTPGWQAMADAFRSRLPEIWRALPAKEQRRVVHRLLPFWEVHRFRIAPQPHELIERQRGLGRLKLERASLVGIDQDGGRLVATLKRPGQRRNERFFDAIVLCTGPGKAIADVPLLRHLLDRGLARPDAIGQGIETDLGSRIVDREGRAQPGLLAIGPLTRGSFGEMTGAPDIVRHIARVMVGLLEPLSSDTLV
ncbi:FAD/NAD(P)-binding protein [Lichenihabitans psoromatis]|uniref:FAD/NAD(P)-binding protein n=1 Tax=Lichenihabitans psoromatis TaxID=2528642 RepID=UPI001038518B|nr:FAD/NAD(P)-binding protein [Lichenihabitans psoromatis]